jgi:hypothetical protein
LFIGISILPSTIGNSNSNGDYNLVVYLKPHRNVFPRCYGGDAQAVVFLAGTSNKGPENCTTFTLKFEIIKIFSMNHFNDSYNYNATTSFPSFGGGGGQGHYFTWYSLIDQRFAIYEARATIDVNDNNLSDNTKSYYFITIG